MSITFSPQSPTTIPTHSTIECCCEQTVYGTAETWTDAYLIAESLERGGLQPTECCDDIRAWPVQQYVGECIDVNLSNTNALNTLRILGLDVDYCGQVESVVLLAALAAKGADMLPRYVQALTGLATATETVVWG